MSSSIDFKSAMEDFKVMFPDMDSDVIEEILRCNHGSVERTIDQLLAIASDNQNEKFMREDHVPNQGNAVQKTNPNNEKGDKAVKSSKWKPVLLPLDPNFLRLNMGGDDFCDEFAVMLQNEEFLAELRFNQEFLSTLEKEQGRTDDRSFEERLKHMGKVSRKKFHQLARIFTFQRKKSSSQKPKSKLLEQDDDDDEPKGGSKK
ncbi:CLUMA_CG017523, isoform A [Clunio marinus]|uniref:CLUMA_CG017523, isoform A n=1 Tax=Clunio marinus TaxID=568069 RepID=A0A1J1IZ45_9DIPT|nr:CLUMA_CG017523, isoform A [Clunio marinus]